MQKLNISDVQKVSTVLDANNIALYDFKVNIYYDTDLANLYFNDFKEGHMNDNVNLFFGSRSTDYLVIFENEKVANTSYYKKSQLARMNKASLYELLNKNNMYITYELNYDEMTKSIMIDNLLLLTNSDYYTQHYENERYQDLDFDFSISGYIQGDYCKVKIVGDVEKWINKERLTNLFYDTPLTGGIEVFKNGSLIDDFQLYDLAHFDEYSSYSKSDIINMIADFCKNDEYCNLLIEYLNDNLSDNFEYRY